MKLLKEPAIYLYLLIFVLNTIYPEKTAATPPALSEALSTARAEAGQPIPPASSAGGKVMMIVIDRLTLADLSPATPASGDRLPNFRRLMEQGALGLMNCNTAGGAGNPENTYATIGAGARVRAPGTSALGFNAGEILPGGAGRQAAEEYRSRTGKDAPRGAVVHLGIARIREQNAGLPYPARPGALGTALRKAGLETAVLGNADSPLGPRRQAVSIAMDENGLVDYGNVGAGLLTKDSKFPGGLRTNYAGLLREMAGLPGDAALTVVEVGDLYRLEEFREDVLKNVLFAKREEILQEIDFFLGQAIRFIDLKKDLLIIVSPTRSAMPPGKENYLSPVLVAGAGLSPGFLFSPSTKRPGIILNTDLAPTILCFFRLSVPGHMLGQPVQVLATTANQPAALSALQKQLALTYAARPCLQKGYIIYQLALLIAGLGCIFRGCSRALSVLQPLLLAVLAVPPAYLLLSLLPQPSLISLTLELIFITAGLTLLALAAARRSPLGSLICSGLLTAGLIMIDSWLGSPLQKTSLMGYDPIIGARFYGIGNEYMGVLTGSLTVGGTAALTLFPRFRRAGVITLGLLFLLAVYVLGNPRLGANMGGVIAASTAFLTTFLLLCGIRFSFKTVACLAGVVIFLVAGLFLIDLQRAPEAQTHFGRNAAIVMAGGWPEVVDIIKRKSEINIKLFKYTIWSRIFLASLSSLTLLFYRPVEVMAGVKRAFPDLYKGFLGVVLGSITALLFNDSGIVAAATTLIFVVSPLIYLILTEQCK